MKKRDIEKTMEKRKFFTEKRRLESQELQFFMMSADNRKLRVKHGAKLFEVLRDQEQVNAQPLTLIETAIPKQKSHADLNGLDKDRTQVSQGLQKSHKRVSSTANLYALLDQQPQQQVPVENISGILLSEYVKDSRFNPIKEISKERNIKDFFQQKYMLLNDYLEDNNDENIQPKPVMKTSISTATLIPSSLKRRQNRRRTINRLSTNAALDFQSQQQQQQIQSQNQTYAGFLHRNNRADKVIEHIEKQVVDQVDREWKRKYDIEEEQKKMKEEIKKISEHSKRRVQMFVDPRSSKVRQNFQMLNKNLSELRRIDPQMRYLQSATSQTRLPHPNENSVRIKQSMDSLDHSQWRKSNADVLAEILKVGRKL